LKPSMKSSISCCISSSGMALAAWSTSIIWPAGSGCVHPVIVGERTAVAGDMGELIEEGVIPILLRCVLPEEALGHPRPCWVRTGSSVSIGKPSNSAHSSSARSAQWGDVSVPDGEGRDRLVS